MKTTKAYPPRCPFCDSLIDAPVELEPKRLGDFAYGRCQCGAVYVYDITGHNIGAAFVEALGYGCNFDWDLAWGLMPEEDYVDAQLERYDLKSHLIHPSGRTEDERVVRGVLLFMKFAPEITSLYGDSMEKKFSNPNNDMNNKTDKNMKQTPTVSITLSKREIKRLIQDGEDGYLETIAIASQKDKKVLNRLQQLLYSPDPSIRWRAIQAIGRASSVIHKNAPAFIGEFLRRLLYSASDSAAANWGAIEACGEIIREIPLTFDVFIRELLSLMRFEDLRPSILWALCRIAEKSQEKVKKRALFQVISILDAANSNDVNMGKEDNTTHKSADTDKMSDNIDAEVRGMAIRLMGILRAKEALRLIDSGIDDEREFSYLDADPEDELNGIMRTMTISEASRKARQLIEAREEKDIMDMESVNSGHIKEANKLFKEGEVLAHQGRSLDAMDKFQEALAIYEAEQYERGIANTCEQLADLHCFRGNLNQAIPLYQRSMTICQKKDDPVSELIVVEKIIDVYRKKGEISKCMPYYMRALEIAEAAGDAGKAGYYLTGIGDIYQRTGDINKALDAYKTALNIFKQTRSGERARILEEGIKRLEEMFS